MKRLLTIAVASLTIACNSAQVEPSQVVMQPLSDDQVKSLVDDVYNKMSTADKVAQLHGIRAEHLQDADGNLSLELCREKIPNGVGHISQFACMQSLTPNELRDFVSKLQDYLINETPMGIPAIFHEEAITGFATLGATTYPQQIGVSCTWNTDLIHLKSDQTREAMRSCGGTMALSPMVDVVRTQHFNRVEECYGEDGYLSSAMGRGFIEGLQSEDLSQGVAACSKHFLGYGGGIDNTNKELMEEVIMPHEVAIRVAGSKTIMTNYGLYKGESTVTSKELLTDMLRGYLGFDGIAVSDYGATASKWKGPKGDTTYLYKRAEAAMNAGNDLELSDAECYPLIPRLVESGKITEERFEEAVKLNLALKARLGLLTKGAKLYNDGDIDLDKPEYRQTAYDIATQSVVLLKNNGILPLDSSKSDDVALVGPNANSFWCMLGDYTYQSMHAFWKSGTIDPDYPKIYNLKEGLEAGMDSKFNLSYERGCDWTAMENGGQIDTKTMGDPRVANLVMMLINSNDPTDWESAMKLGSNNDVIIAAVGENPTLCGEGRFRKGIRLPGDQERFVEELIETGKPVVVVMFGGRAQMMSQKIMDGAAAIVQAWYPGEEGGNAVADILLGDVNPSGKLCVTYPATEDEANICYNTTEGREELVAYPFGYGLSYTTYEYSNLSSPSSVTIGKEDIELSFTLTNAGERAGEEIVQLYISPKGKSTTHKPIQLKGFERVALEAGESKVVSFKFSPEILAYYADEMWRMDSGEFVLKVGASSSDIRLSADIEINGSVAPKTNRDYFFSHSSSTAIN